MSPDFRDHRCRKVVAAPETSRSGGWHEVILISVPLIRGSLCRTSTVLPPASGDIFCGYKTAKDQLNVKHVNNQTHNIYIVYFIYTCIIVYIYINRTKGNVYGERARKNRVEEKG